MHINTVGHELSSQRLFNYDALDSGKRKLLRKATGEIRERITSTMQGIVEIGRKLIVIKGIIPRGQFGAYLESEFGWTERMSQRFMSVAALPQSDKMSDLKIATTALYALAAPSTPDEVRQDFFEKAERGETVTHADVKVGIELAKACGILKNRWRGLGDDGTSSDFGATQGQFIYKEIPSNGASGFESPPAGKLLIGIRDEFYYIVQHAPDGKVFGARVQRERDEYGDYLIDGHSRPLDADAMPAFVASLPSEDEETFGVITWGTFPEFSKPTCGATWLHGVEDEWARSAAA